MTLPNLAGHPWIPGILESLAGRGCNASQSALARGEPKTQRTMGFLGSFHGVIGCQTIKLKQAIRDGALDRPTGSTRGRGRTSDGGNKRSGRSGHRYIQGWPSCNRGQRCVPTLPVTAMGERAIAESKGGMASIDGGDVIQISGVLGIHGFEVIGQRCTQQAWNARFARQWWIAKRISRWRKEKGWLRIAKTLLGSAARHCQAKAHEPPGSAKVPQGESTRCRMLRFETHSGATPHIHDVPFHRNHSMLPLLFTATTNASV